MFTGGYPSKMYNYTEDNINIIKKMLADFYDYIVYINSKLININYDTDCYISEFDALNRQLKEGFYQQLLVDLMKNIKKKYSDNIDDLVRIKNTLVYFMNILLPDIKI